MKKLLPILSLFLILVVVPLPVSATTLTFTDSTLSPGDNITYTLTFGTGPTFNATFTVANSANTSPEFFAGWFLFKFDGPTPGTITNISGPASTGPWLFASTASNVNVLQGGGNFHTLAQDGFYGFYQQFIAEGQPLDITKGILLTGSPTTSTFTFNFTATGDVNLTSMPFQVGYYDGLTGAGNPIFNQLSNNLTQVPEPATLLLLGCGLLGVAGVTRIKKFRK